ncbi:MAG TPA: putative sulfate/molybdate transporter [Actinomycetota bacterium]|nr:putative sulfate/molybdate transporter [Actinomycetota bacterium]
MPAASGAGGPGGFRIGLGEATGAVADLGVLVPLAAALILVNGVDAGALMVGAGALLLAAGVAFRVPFPVQPLKALTAVAVAQGLAPPVIHAAGIEIGAFLVLLSVRQVADAIARLFTPPVVRALQFGVGSLLVIAAVRLILEPPAVFRGTPPSPWPVVLAVAAFAAVSWEARRQRYGLALAVLAAGVAAAWLLARPSLRGPSFQVPLPGFPPAAAFGSAFLLLVVPQLPLTFGNAVVAVDDLAHRYFGPAAGRVTPSRVCFSCGVGNVVAGLIGGMPMCHGAGGLTAHVRLGARTAGMNLLLGTAFLLAGLYFAPQVPVLLGLLPVWALAAFLAYAGLRHALLVADLRGAELAIALVAGAAGAAVSNLALTAAAALAAAHGGRALRRRYPSGNGPRGPGSYSASSNSPS